MYYIHDLKLKSTIRDYKCIQFLIIKTNIDIYNIFFIAYIIMPFLNII